MGRYGWPGTVICIAPFPSTYLASTFLTSRQPRNLPQPPPPIMPSLPHLEQPRICHPITGCSDALGEGRIIFMTPRYACSNARAAVSNRSEEHTSELQSLMRNSYAVFCLKKKKQNTNERHHVRKS